MDLACQCQISSHLTAIISALIVTKESPSLFQPTALAIRRISQSTVLLPHDLEVGSHYWEFLRHPSRCGVLYNYARIINFWLLFLEVPPDPEGPYSLDREECRKLMLANWSRMLSKCVPGDKDLICRLRDFTLD